VRIFNNVIKIRKAVLHQPAGLIKNENVKKYFSFLETSTLKKSFTTFSFNKLYIPLNGTSNLA